MTLFGPAEPAVERAETRAAGKRGLEKTCRLRLVVAYDGSGFRGFAAQDGQKTVAGELARAISTVAREAVELTCAGRTDAGVHAEGQVVHVDVPAELEPQRLLKAVNAMVGPSIVVRGASVAAEGFDARRSAHARLYRYLILNSPTPDPLLAPVSWHVPERLDVRSMSAAADSFIGEHDFRAFCRRPPGTSAETPLIRKVLEARWSRSGFSEDQPVDGAVLRFEVRAQSFCHQMVRSMVGTLVEVGRGRRRVSDVTALLSSTDRSQAKTIAPPHALCLVSVDY